MTLRAKAFPEGKAAEKMDQLFAEGNNQVFAGSAATTCPKCDTRFAIFLKDKTDQDNQVYIDRLVQTISDDCNQGRHKPEYTWLTTP